METTVATFNGVEPSTCAASIADDLCAPEAALGAACYLHGTIERSIGSMRVLVDAADCPAPAKAMMGRCIREVDSYAYALGVMVNDAREGVSGLRSAARSAIP